MPDSVGKGLHRELKFDRTNRLYMQKQGSPKENYTNTIIWDFKRK